MAIETSLFYRDTHMLRAMHKAYAAARPRTVLLYDALTKDSLTKLLQQVRQKKKKRIAQYQSRCFSEADLPASLFSPVASLASDIVRRKLSIRTAKLLALGASDYRIAHDAAREEPGIDIILDITPAWDQKWGGQVAYVDGSGDALVLPAAKNLLAIVERKKSIQRIVTYVNHHAGRKKRVFVLVRCK